MIKCKNCGGELRFDPGTQKYVCDFCGSSFTHEELSEEEKEGKVKAEEQRMYEEPAGDGYMNVFTYTCPQCGGELFTTEETAATFCSYCGSSVLLESRVSKEQKPDYIIPFQITKEQAAEIYNKKLKGSIFAPSYIRHMDIEKVRGIYMPYWTYQLEGRGVVKGEKVENRPVPGGTQVNKYSVSSLAYVKGDGIEYDSASSFPDDLSQTIAPYKFSEAKKFEASYMSGFYADAGDMPEEAYFEEARSVMKELAANVIADQMDVSSADIEKTMPELDIKGERAMYPVWFISARNKAMNKVSYAVVNGQTGKAAADIPVDNKKLIIGMLCIAVPLFALLYFLITPTPAATAVVVLLLSILGAFFAVKRMAAIRLKSGNKKAKTGKGMLIAFNIIAAVFSLFIFTTKAYEMLWLPGAAIVLDIIALVKTAKNNVKTGTKPNKVYALPLILSISSVVVCIIALIWNPVKDMYYYICIIIAGLCSGCAYWSMFTIHNKGTLRALPQLGKRGGDE